MYITCVLANLCGAPAFNHLVRQKLRYSFYTGTPSIVAGAAACNEVWCCDRIKENSLYFPLLYLLPVAFDELGQLNLVLLHAALHYHGALAPNPSSKGNLPMPVLAARSWHSLWAAPSPVSCDFQAGLWISWPSMTASFQHVQGFPNDAKQSITDFSYKLSAAGSSKERSQVPPRFCIAFP